MRLRGRKWSWFGHVCCHDTLPKSYWMELERVGVAEESRADHGGGTTPRNRQASHCRRRKWQNSMDDHYSGDVCRSTPPTTFIPNVKCLNFGAKWLSPIKITSHAGHFSLTEPSRKCRRLSAYRNRWSSDGHSTFGMKLSSAESDVK